MLEIFSITTPNLNSTCFNKILTLSFICFRWSVEPPQPIQLEATSKKEKKIANGLHKPPDLRAGETVSLPKVLITSG